MVVRSLDVAVAAAVMVEEIRTEVVRPVHQREVLVGGMQIVSRHDPLVHVLRSDEDDLDVVLHVLKLVEAALAHLGQLAVSCPQREDATGHLALPL